MATLTGNDGSVDDTFNYGVNQKAAQDFKIAAGATITGFSIKGSKGNTTPCTNFTAEIYEGGTDPTNGTLKKTQSFSSTSLGAYTGSPTFHDFSFTTDTGALTGGSTVYWLVISPTGGSGTDTIRWSLDNTSPAYADGNTWYNFGSWVNAGTGFDQNFAIYGTTGGGGGGSVNSSILAFM
jgi:hypothetical protein